LYGLILLWANFLDDFLLELIWYFLCDDVDLYFDYFIFFPFFDEYLFYLLNALFISINALILLFTLFDSPLIVYYLFYFYFEFFYYCLYRYLSSLSLYILFVDFPLDQLVFSFNLLYFFISSGLIYIFIYFLIECGWDDVFVFGLLIFLKSSFFFFLLLSYLYLLYSLSSFLFYDFKFIQNFIFSVFYPEYSFSDGNWFQTFCY
jgi:hypothetical protein